SRATGVAVTYASAPDGERSPRNPRAVLRSLLPDGARVLSLHARGDGYAARVSGLRPGLLGPIQRDFARATGRNLDLGGQLVFDF
ncbi:MAG: hypothetical protein AAGC55_33525, partial [Myxococcota bacterium]